MLIAILQLAVGLLLLYVAGEAVVRGASSLARELGLSNTVIGLTVVAYGTSAPEMAVGVVAAVENHPDIVIGNVVGSNIFNICLVIGLAAVLRPLLIERDFMETYGAFLLLSSLMFILFGFDGLIHPLEGGIMLALLILYTYWLLRRQRELKNKESRANDKRLVQSAFLVIAGLLGLYFGSELLINAVVSLALFFNVGEEFLGLTIVAAGTGLPELAASLVAAYRKEHGITIGNIAGSNIFNIMGIIGASSVAAPLAVHATIYPSYFFMVVLTVALLTAKRGAHVLGRVVGSVFLALYVIYLILLSTGL
jgi:cation:H+ antiporter